MTRSAQLAVDSRGLGARASGGVFGLSIDASWTFLAGALGSGVVVWEPLFALRLVAAWLVADAAFRHVLQQLLFLKSWPRRAEGDDLAPAPPEQVRSSAWSVAVSALVGSGLILCLATYIGREALLVAAGGLFTAGLSTALAGRSVALLQRWLAFTGLATAWLLGHAALAPITHASLGLALAIGLAGYARAGEGGRALDWWIVRWTWALLLFVALQGRQPVVAAVVATAALAELVVGRRGAPGAWTPRTALRERLGWLTAIALVGLAASSWG